MQVRQVLPVQAQLFVLVASACVQLSVVEQEAGRVVSARQLSDFTRS
jgi:hypothetical protein